MSQNELIELKKQVLNKYNTFVMNYYNTCSRGPAASSFSEQSLSNLYNIFEKENAKLPEEHRVDPKIKMQMTL